MVCTASSLFGETWKKILSNLTCKGIIRCLISICATYIVNPELVIVLLSRYLDVWTFTNGVHDI